MSKVVIRGNVPSKSNSYRIVTINGHGTLAKTDKVKKYEEAFMWQCGEYRNAGIDQPFEMIVDVYFPSKRSDLDNAMKVLMDMLQRVKAIKNDNLCARIVAQKFIDKQDPRIEFELKIL